MNLKRKKENKTARMKKTTIHLSLYDKVTVATKGKTKQVHAATAICHE